MLRLSISRYCLFLIRQQISDESSTMCVICETGNTYPSTARGLILILVGFVLLNLQFFVQFFVDKCLTFSSFSFGRYMVVYPLISWFVSSDLSQGNYKFNMDTMTRNKMYITYKKHVSITFHSNTSEGYVSTRAN